MIKKASDTVLPLLRKATAELHAKLDNSLPLASAHPSIEDYLQHLLAFKHWLSEMAECIDRNVPPSNASSQITAMTLTLLERDLQALNVKVSSPAPNVSPAEPGVAYCLGIEYVVKGSALGTAMLHHKTVQMFPAAPIEFMQDSKMHGKQRWQEFLEKLESHQWSEEDLAKAQEGSIWAFQRYIKLHEMSSSNDRINAG